jgi:hypothetical protein
MRPEKILLEPFSVFVVFFPIVQCSGFAGQPVGSSPDVHLRYSGISHQTGLRDETSLMDSQKVFHLTDCSGLSFRRTPESRKSKHLLDAGVCRHDGKTVFSDFLQCP